MSKSFRDALKDALAEIAKENNKMVVLNADSSRALKLTNFQEQYPERMFGFGISEADMLVSGAGMATTGLIPVIVGFSVFVVEKPFEQIRQSIAYTKLNVKIIATHSGLCVGQDGASHQAIEDIAILRTLPNMTIFVAADSLQAKAIIKEMIVSEGPMFLKLGRDAAEDIYKESCKCEVGGADLLVEGHDVTIIACGLMVEKALEAAKELKRKNIFASVINAYCIKPLNEYLILSEIKRTNAVITVEDHSVIGGLGGAVAELTAKKYPVNIRMVGVQDTFGESGSQEDLYNKYGLTVTNIIEFAQNLVELKKENKNE